MGGLDFKGYDVQNDRFRRRSSGLSLREYPTPMVFEHIEKLKREYTDKFVVVDEARPELVRFRGLTGQVRTVNMSGRALVEFDGYNNIGWYDIDIDFLKVVDAPQPKEEKKAERPAGKAAVAKKKTAPAKEAAPEKKAAVAKEGGSVDDILAAARAGAKPKKDKPAAKPAAKSDDEPSVDDILAAARSGAKAKPGSKPAKAGGEMGVDDVLAAARAGAKPKPGKPAGKPAATPSGDMSVDDILAAARSGAKAKPAGEASPKKAQEMNVEDVLAAARAGKGGAKGTAPAKPKGGDDAKSVAEALASARTPKGETAKPADTPQQASAATQEMSVADVLAAARGEKPADGPQEPTADKPVAPSKDESDKPSTEKPPAPAGNLPTEVADIIEFCRKTDGG